MHRLLIALALLLLAPLATAQVYKWTDASGTVHYSQDAPPQGTKYKRVTTTGTVEPPAAPASTSSTASAIPPAGAAAPAGGAAENSSKYCVTLKTNLTALQGSGPVAMQQQDGKATALDDDQRKQQATAIQSLYNQYCQSQ